MRCHNAFNFCRQGLFLSLLISSPMLRLKSTLPLDRFLFFEDIFVGIALLQFVLLSLQFVIVANVA
jgi:hypothetical protein